MKRLTTIAGRPVQQPADLDDPQGDILQGMSLAVVLALIAVGVSIGAGFALFGHADDAAVTAKIEAEARARKAVKPCEILIRQFGAGERWTQPDKPYECAAASRGERTDVLTSPAASQ